MVTVRLLCQVNWSEGGLVGCTRDCGWGRYIWQRGSGHSLGARLPGSTLGFITPSWVILEGT